MVPLPIHLFALSPVPGPLLPLIGSRVPAGFPSPADDYIEARIDLNQLLIKKPAATYMAQVVGDSMEGDGIFEGDRIIVVMGKAVKAGMVVVAVVNGEFLVKRYQVRGGRAVLESSNPKYPPIEIPEGAEMQVWGVVEYVIHPL